MAINFNDYLKMTGLGESASITGKRRRRRRNVKPGKFNPVAFAESYAYAIQDGRRMRLSGIANQREASRITARGEAGLEDAKQFIKDKSKQAWEFLKKLYEKVIRFFTETLRYLMSNERKIGKCIAKLKAAKKTNKDELEANIPVYTELISREEGYYGYGEYEPIGMTPGEKRRAKEELKNKINSSNATAQENEELKNQVNDYKKKESDWAEQKKRLTAELNNVNKAFARVNAKNAELKKAQAAGEKVATTAVSTEVASTSVGRAGGSDGSNGGDGSNPRNLPAVIVQTAKEGAEAAKTVQQTCTSVVKDEVSSYQGRYFLIFGNLLVDAYLAADARIDCASGFGTLVEGNDEVSDAISEFKEMTNTLFKNANEGNGTVKGSRSDYIAYVDTYISGLERIKASRPMFGIQKTVRDLQKEKAALDKARRKSSREDKMNDDKTLQYQLRRGSLQGKIKLANLYIGITDKAIGKILSVGGKIAAAA